MERRVPTRDEVLAYLKKTAIGAGGATTIRWGQ